jgi:hypothetical protein
MEAVSTSEVSISLYYSAWHNTPEHSNLQRILILLHVRHIENCFVTLLLLMAMGCSELRPSTGLLFIPQVISEHGEPRWNDTDRGKPKNLEKICPSATLSTTNPTRTDPGLRGERPATNRLSHYVYILHSI